MNLWFTELEFSFKNVGLTLKIKKQLHHEETQYQVLDIFETYHYGKMMTLDGIIQLTELDEFFYHEMISHVPLFMHPNPQNVLIIGGGDGGTVREVLKHKSVQQVDMIEIDEKVIATSKRFFPTVSEAFNDERLKVQIADGIKYVAECIDNKYDVIIIDSSDPVGPAIGLFSSDFYSNCYRILKAQGVVIAQAGTFWYQPEESQDVRSKMKEIFDYADLYWSITPTYPSGQMTYAFGCKGLNPYKFDKMRTQDETIKTKYYNPDIHMAAFALPTYMLYENDKTKKK